MTSAHARSRSLAQDDVSLDALFVEVRRHILERQHPISGLLPASTAVTAHGDYTDAWVRDNVYSILGPWALGIACRHAGEPTRAFELEQAVVRNMRGLLTAMMRQADRVERFKASLDPIDALHAKYDTATGEAVVGDEEWGHLQLDATSLYLLMLVQMTASGLTIVQGRDEVDFVQNLIWYLSRAYVVPDYGIWERGNKINHGVRELNASSLGLVLAALKAADGFDLFGPDGDARSRLLVVPDDIARVRQCLDSILPRESASKEIDSALLAVTGFPAFAAGEKAGEVIERIETRLAGRYGYKRFLRDGHQTAIEDESKLHYEPEELEAFARIECEWPLFFTYRLINACFAGDLASARAVNRQIESVAVREGGAPVLPELYFVPAESIEAERERPGSVTRLANENRPLVWAQSLWVVGRLLLGGFIRPADIDPLGRHRDDDRPTRYPVGVALLARTERVADGLAAAGVTAVTPEGRQRTSVIPADALVGRLASFGANGHLALTGRPARRLLGLSAARVVSTDDGQSVVLPALFDGDTFLLGRDAELLVHEVRTSLAYLARHATWARHPVWVIPVDEWMLDGPGRDTVLSFCRELAQGELDGMPVRLAHLDALVGSASRWVLPGELPSARPAEPFVPGRWERGGDVDGLADALGESPSVDALVDAFGQAVALDERLVLLRWLRDADVPPGRRFADVDGRVGDWHAHGIALLRLAQRIAAWRVMRLTADLVGVVDGFLEVALMDLVVRQKRVAVGRSYSRRAVIDAPISNREILHRIHAYCGDDPRERALTQELVIHLGAWLRASPELFDHVLTLRTGPLLQILVALRARESGTSPAHALDELVSMAPQEVRQRLREAIDWRDRPERLEALHRRDGGGVANGVPRGETAFPRGATLLGARLVSDDDPAEAVEGREPAVDWYHQRQIGGAMSRLPERFYEGVWELLGHVPALVIGNRYDSRNVLDSQVYRGQSTAREHNFALAVEHRLNRIEAPEYRELTVEAIVALIEILTAGEDLVIEEPLVLDVVIGHAVRLAWMAEHPDDAGRYDDARADAWQAFYRRSPRAVAHWVGRALDHLLTADRVERAGQTGDAGRERETME